MLTGLAPTTITFENIQNVTVQQGPVQRHYGIADVIVQTAGGGGGEHGKHGAAGAGMTHIGLIQGVDNAPEIRDLILARVKRSRSAGLGDERHAEAARAWTSEHLAALREIRAAARALAR